MLMEKPWHFGREQRGAGVCAIKADLAIARSYAARHQGLVVSVISGRSRI